MIAEIGLFLLILAGITAGLQFWHGIKPAGPRTVLSSRLAYAQLVSCAAAFACLIMLFAQSDLSVLNVIQNSHTMKPFLYKVSATWASHEGSMLLWCFMLAVFGGLIAGRGDMPDRLKARALGVQGCLSLGFLSFLIFTSNPFARVIIPPYDGQDLNPILQDPSLAIHPPMLFLGYVGFSAQFALAMAVLLEPEQMGRHWVRLAKTFTLIAWFALTAGLCLGAYWAYYELGWGGWWFWDPVENAALMPWLTGTALLHTLRVQEVRGCLQKWTILLSILTFGLSILGTFLVRSGLLTSVHSFAVDPERGLFLLTLAGIYIGGGLLLYALRARQLEVPVTFTPLSRETVLVLNNLLLLTITGCVFIGTAYPIVLPVLTGTEISVGASYFNTALLPLAVPMLVLMGAGIHLGWKKTASGTLRDKMKQSLWPLGLAVIAGVAVFWVYADVAFSKRLAAAGWIGLALWLMAGAVQYIGPVNSLAGAFIRLNKNQKSMVLAHIGVGVAVLGMVGSGLLAQEREALMSRGDVLKVGPYVLELIDFTPVIGPNYTATQGRFDVREAKSGDEVITLTPQRRTYPIAQSKTTETAIRTGIKDAIYIALGEAELGSGDNINRKWIVRAQYHPLIAFLWLGMGLVVLAALVHIPIRKVRLDPERYKK